MKSTMFLQNVTVIDHAWVDDKGEINGNSYNLCVEITGEIDEQEQVVIDFSGCKKAIKHLVDDSEFAIDHRLVVVNGLSDAIVGTESGKMHVDTPVFSAESTVSDWVQVIKPYQLFEKNLLIPVDTKYMNYVSEYLEQMLQEQLVKLGYPVTFVTVELSEKFDLPSWSESHVEFNYAHGLRSSTSYGCQNIAHGHRSFIAVDVKTGPTGRKELKRIAEEMSGYLAHADNIAGDRSVEYVSGRGYFRMQHENTIWLPNETTVENLAEFIANKYRDEFEAMGASRLWVSEGLSKGAVVSL